MAQKQPTKGSIPPAEHEGHRQRLKERYTKEGIDHFQYHNALELLLFFGIPRKDTNRIAYQLLQTFGSLSGVFDASIEELQHVKGMTHHAAVLIKLTRDMARLYLEDRNSDGVILNTTEAVGSYLSPKFIGRPNEVVYILCLDNKHKLLYCDILSEGTINSAPIILRTIMEIALRVRAASVVLAHNHPQGFALPSADDLAATDQIYQTLKLVGVTLQDHIIFAKDDYVSLRDSGQFYDME